MTTHFLWDSRPGRNVDHLAERGMTPELWEEVYRRASRRGADKDDPTILIAEGRVSGGWYRIVYAVLDDGSIIPVTILPITGFPIERRGLR